MNTALVIRAGWVSLCLLVFATASFSHTSARATPSPIPSPAPQEVVYTGSLFGYFRLPSKQSGVAEFQPCRQSGDNDSQAAIDFLKNRQRYQQSVLVGTGDNCA